MMNIVVNGAAGRMGKMVITATHDERELALTGAIEARGHPALDEDAGQVAGVGETGVKITDDIMAAIEGADVLIDFTIPESTILAVTSCSNRAEGEIAFVSGTTGLSDKDEKKIKGFSAKIPIVRAPNMSVGVNLLFRLAGEVAHALGDDFDVEIVEAHHRQKVDAPSGTAKRLFEILSEALNRDPSDVGIYGREGMVGKRTDKEIGVMAVRAGDIVGEHTIIFGGIGERIELTHKAHSRMTFAKGAIRAAKWVYKREPGLYDMQDVLGLKSK